MGLEDTSPKYYVNISFNLSNNFHVIQKEGGYKCHRFRKYVSATLPYQKYMGRTKGISVVGEWWGPGFGRPR